MSTFLEQLREAQARVIESTIADHDLLMMNILKPAILDKLIQFRASLLDQAKLLNPSVSLFIKVDITELLTKYFDLLAQMSSIRTSVSTDVLINKQADVEHYYSHQCERLISIKKIIESEFSGLDVSIGISWPTSDLGFHISGSLKTSPVILGNEPGKIQVAHPTSL